VTHNPVKLISSVRQRAREELTELAIKKKTYQDQGKSHAYNPAGKFS